MIESSLQYEGTVEQIRRLTALIDYSRQKMRASDFIGFEADMQRRIARLEAERVLWLQSQDELPRSTLTCSLVSSRENALAVDRGSPPPASHFISVKRPANLAGLSLCAGCIY